MQTLREYLQPLLETIEHKLGLAHSWTLMYPFALDKLSDFNYNPSMPLEELQERLKDALKAVFDEAFPGVVFPEKIITVRDNPIADITIRYTGR